MQSVALINYGSGNLRSAEKALIRAADGKSQIVVTNDRITAVGKRGSVSVPADAKVIDAGASDHRPVVITLAKK